MLYSWLNLCWVLLPRWYGTDVTNTLLQPYHSSPDFFA
jgi:hypothetical protein